MKYFTPDSKSGCAVAGDVLGNVGAASFCMAHLAQDSSIRAGDAFDGPGGTVRVEAAVVSRISFKVRVLGSNLAISGKSLDLFIGCDEAAFAVADSDAVEVARLAEKTTGTWWKRPWSLRNRTGGVRSC